MKIISKSGYTAIEMIIVLTIVGILTAVLIPVIKNYLPGIELNGTARILTADLRNTQEKAITEQNRYGIRFKSPTQNSYQVIHFFDESEEISATKYLSSEQTLELASSITSNEIIFSADGGPSSSGDITLSRGTSQKVITVSPAGFIMVRE